MEAFLAERHADSMLAKLALLGTMCRLWRYTICSRATAYAVPRQGPNEALACHFTVAEVMAPEGGLEGLRRRE